MEEYQSFLQDVGSGEGIRCNHTVRLDTYGCGCSHNCAYCYARAILEFRGNWHPEDPHVADIGKVAEAISRMEPGSVVRLGGMTDCLQAAERVHGVTRRAIELLNQRGVHQLIVTKSDLIADYMDVLDPDLSHVQVSITSTSDGPNPFGERAPSPSKRMEAVRRLSEGGFDVCVRLSPYVPELVDVGLLRDRTCGKVLVEFLRVNGQIRKLLHGVDLSPYRLVLGGYRHLPLKVKREWLRPILGSFEQVSVCEDVFSHWQVWRNEVNWNKRDCCNLRGVCDGDGA